MRDVTVAAPLHCGLPLLHQQVRCTANPAACPAQLLPAAPQALRRSSVVIVKHVLAHERPGDRQLVFWLQADAGDLQQEDSGDSWPAVASLTGMHVDDVTRTAQMITRQVVFILT